MSTPRDSQIDHSIEESLPRNPHEHLQILLRGCSFRQLSQQLLILKCTLFDILEAASTKLVVYMSSADQPSEPGDLVACFASALLEPPPRSVPFDLQWFKLTSGMPSIEYNQFLMSNMFVGSRSYTKLPEVVDSCVTSQHISCNPSLYKVQIL